MQSALYDDGSGVDEQHIAVPAAASKSAYDCNVLFVHCTNNASYEGVWLKAAVEQDIEYAYPGLLAKKRNNKCLWVNWILSRLISPEDIDQSVIEAICIPNVRSISYMSKHSGMIQIHKCFQNDNVEGMQA